MLIPKKAIKLAQGVNATVLVPSMSHAYSLGMEYILKWFFSKIDREFFASIYINDASAISEFRNFNTIDNLKKNLPALTIESKLDMDYLQEVERLPDGGMDIFLTRTARQAAFFYDPDKHTKIALDSETIKIQYNFKIKVKTKSQQMDLMHYIKQACRIGETQTQEFDMDFHVPMELMVQVADDMGFKIKDGNIVDVNDFLFHINQLSYFPFTYRIRTATQNMEFFIRVCDIPFYINATDSMSLDEGERINMVTDNYTLEFPLYLIMSAPKMYIYYSFTDHFYLGINDKLHQNTVKIGLHDIHLRAIPDQNSKGWGRFITADYSLVDEDKDITYKENSAIINLFDLIKDSDIEVVYNYANKYSISPSVFLDFHIFANGEELKTEMNWTNLTCKISNTQGLIKVGVVLYLNKQFVNERIIQLTNAHGDRLTKNTRTDSY